MSDWFYDLIREYFRGFSPITSALIPFFPLLFLTMFLSPGIFVDGLRILFYTSPLWLMYIGPRSVHHYWIHYIQHQFIDDPGQKPILLELLIPKDEMKSPRAMEVVFEALHYSLQMNPIFQTGFKGHVRPWFTIELVSTEGKLRFYVWTWEKLRDRVESAFYSQYPNLQIVPAKEDYSMRFDFERDKPKMWGCSFKLEKGDAYPIKTYYDFELEKDPKAEHKVDPLLTMLELMSDMGPHEHMWFQILFQMEHTDRWKDDVMVEIDKIYERATPEHPGTKPGEKVKGFPQLRPMQYELIKGMERCVTKHAFRTGIRGVYITDPGHYSSNHSRIVQRVFLQYNSMEGSEYYNVLKIDPDQHLAGFDWPWEDFRGIYRQYRAKWLLYAYQKRSYFHPPYKMDPMILTTEELATIFHIPGSESQVLGLTKTESKRGAPPVNLPS